MSAIYTRDEDGYIDLPVYTAMVTITYRITLTGNRDGDFEDAELAVSDQIADAMKGMRIDDWTETIERA